MDFTGVWERSIVLGPLGRTNARLNEAGKARHAEFQKGAGDTELLCAPCAPDSFYRGLQFDGVLEEYFGHRPDLGQQ